jgi:group II intron reverse transcriptase/maturase
LFSRDHRPTEADWQQEEPVDKAKPFDIPKREVWEAFKKVKANQGAAGVDRQTIADFEADLSNNLYELWNRLSSGSYFPPPVRRVDIPKVDGGSRPLGIPTVADRVAQEVVRRYLEPRLEPVFHADSYGYRPGKSAIDAVRQARQRCWRYDWVLDIDVKAYFDSIDWELMLRAVRHHTSCPWVLLYIERWLKAPVQLEDGSVVLRTSGTPQGGVVSPVLANLFLHYAFDMWMKRTYPHIQFERYADDAICHCKSAEEAQALWSALADRFAPASWCCILRRQESSTARMRTGVATSRTNRSIFSVSVSERGKRYGKVFFPRTASCPPPARRHSRPSAGQSGDGRFISAVTSPCRTWPTCTIRTLGAGSTTTANSIERS